jgi:hypothetical protein
VPIPCCGSVASPQKTFWAPAWVSDDLCGRRRATTHLPSVLLLLQQRRVAAGTGLGTGLVGNSIKYERRTANGAAGNGPGTTAKYLRRTSNRAAGNVLGTTIKYL